MNFLEKNLETIIFETDNTILQERGLEISGVKRRQVRIGNYGICDIVTINRMRRNNALDIKVYELKRDFVDVSTLLQSLSYCRGIQRFFQKRGISAFFSIVLIGLTVDKNSSFAYLPDLLSADFTLELYEYKYDFDGISFNSIDGLCLPNEGF